MAFHLKQKGVVVQGSIGRLISTSNVLDQSTTPKQILNHVSLSAHLRVEYLVFSCSHGWRSAFQVLLASLLFDLVQGGARLIGCCNGLLRPVVYQFVKIIGERASLVVAVVGLDLSKPCDWLRRRRGRGCGERRLRRRRLTGGSLSGGGVERRP